MDKMRIVEAKGISKIYAGAASPLKVLSGLSLSVEEGERIGIYGASGSGKSTLLHILGGIDFATSGEISVAGRSISSISQDQLSDFRNRTIGFVFQFYHLLPEFTAVENVMLPALISGLPFDEARNRSMASLSAVGLAERADHRPGMLSGGEQQRVAIARASVMRPKIIFADEPTGNLDRESGKVVWNYLMELNRSEGISLILVTHNRELVKSLSKAYELRDGALCAYSDGELR